MRCSYPRVTLAALALTLGIGWTAAHACTSDPECNDGNVCNGAETCNTGSGLCEPGTPLGDGALCDAGTGVTCTFIDTCQAGVCVPGGGGDSDGDNLCDTEDNCPAIANPGQGDLDEDEIGNVCDAVDGPIEVVRAKLKFDNAKDGKTPRGKIVVKGDFFDPDPVANFEPALGLLVRMQDSLPGTPLNAVFTWLPGECETNVKGNHKCKSADKRFKAIMRPLRSFPGIVRFRMVFKRLDKTVVPGPFVGPVTMTITTAPAALTAGIDRVGAITDCQQVGSGLKCKE